MEINTYWNHAPGYIGDDGICWVGVEGPVGSVAISGGGYGSYNDPNVDFDEQPADPLFPIVASLPDPGSPRGWKLGIAAPRNANGKITGHVCVTVLEDL